MKGVFVAKERDDVRNSALAFVVANIYFIVQGFVGFEITALDRVVDFMWGLGLATIILSFTTLLEDKMSEYGQNFKYGYYMAGILVIGSTLLDLGQAMVHSDPEAYAINTQPTFLIVAWMIVTTYYLSEGVISNIYRYLMLLGGMFGLVATSADVFFGYDAFTELPDVFQFVFLIPWLGFTFGVGLGAYTAWGNRE
jgi:hypothetical protein|tara:strand:+ start:749 stop:1336 length:588 start_codon:yes stop_codon:yes gene_type:complete